MFRKLLILFLGLFWAISLYSEEDYQLYSSEICCKSNTSFILFSQRLIDKVEVISNNNILKVEKYRKGAYSFMARGSGVAEIRVISEKKKKTNTYRVIISDDGPDTIGYLLDINYNLVKIDNIFGRTQRKWKKSTMRSDKDIMKSYGDMNAGHISVSLPRRKQDGE